MPENQPNTTTLNLAVELAPGCDDALLRVISVLHRRACWVRQASYTASPAGALIELSLDAPRARAHRVPVWLKGLIDVTGVNSRDVGGALAA